MLEGFKAVSLPSFVENDANQRSAGMESTPLTALNTRVQPEQSKENINIVSNIISNSSSNNNNNKNQRQPHFFNFEATYLMKGSFKRNNLNIMFMIKQYLS